MNVHVLQHVSFEGLGSMAAWCDRHKALVTYTRFFDSDPLTDLASIDMVIAMGGPMSVNNEAQYPWLKTEKAFIREAVERGISVVGVCLGAQLIASALGSRVYPNTQKEIGWFPIEVIACSENTFQFPTTRTTVFHWHGETFDLPPNAVHLASSPACKHQAFQIGTHVIGLQFHLETKPESVEALIHHCRDELVDGAYIQTEDAMRSTPGKVYNHVNKLMGDVLSYITQS